jgi:hypothetical protein
MQSIPNHVSDVSTMETNEYITSLKEFNLITSEEFLKAIRAFGMQARAGKLSSSITEKLQIFDIITQRLQHLVDTHEKVMCLYIDDIFKVSFLRLQHFQFSIIAFDLFGVLSFIDSNLREVAEPCDTCQQNNTLRSTNTARLAALFEKIKKALKHNAGDSGFLKPLTTRQISICTKLYSMESERVVLDWYLKNPSGEFPELLEVYQSWLINYSGPSIELFDNV